MGFFIESGVVEFLYLTLLAFWFIYLYFVKDYGYWEERKVPHVPSVFPLGSMSAVVLGKNFSGEEFDSIYRSYKEERYVGFIYIRVPSLLIRDPELIKLVLKKDFFHFTDHTFSDINPKDYLFYNLFNMKGQEWREMRCKLSPAYTAAKMKMMFGFIKDCSDILRQVLRKATDENSAIDVKELMSRFTIDVIATCTFGIQADCLTKKDSELYNIGINGTKMDFSVLLKIYAYYAFPIVQKVHCFNLYDPRIYEFLRGIICSAVEQRESLNVTRYDFLDLLMRLRQNQSILEEGEKHDDLHEIYGPKSKEGLTIEDIIAQTYLFFIAGYETTSSTIVFSLYELACNCKIQDKLYWEIEEVLGRHKGTISYHALQEMTYMDQIINETLRFYPIFPYLSRTCTKNYKVPNSTLVIEKGTQIIIPIYSLHHDPEYYPDPHTFDPERFNLAGIKARRPFTFLPFGEGPRICIGFRFGLMEVKTALATLISDYEISLGPDTDVPLKMKSDSFTTLPSKPLKLLFNRRIAR